MLCMPIVPPMNNAIALKHDTIIAMVTRVRLPPDNGYDNRVAGLDSPSQNRKNPPLRFIDKFETLGGVKVLKWFSS